TVQGDRDRRGGAPSDENRCERDGNDRQSDCGVGSASHARSRVPGLSNAYAPHGGGGVCGGLAPGGGIDGRLRRRTTTIRAIAAAAITTAEPIMSNSPKDPDWYRYDVSSWSATRIPLPSYDSRFT